MPFRNILPVPWPKKDLAIKQDEWLGPFHFFRREMNRLFDNLLDDSPLTRVFDRQENYYPSIDIRETDKEYKISAELPGLESKDVDISINNDVLTIKGQKKLEKEEKGENFFRMERSYGSFFREIPLPLEIDSNKIEAIFKNGVLDIHLPKKAESQRKSKRIEIKVD